MIETTNNGTVKHLFIDGEELTGVKRCLIRIEPGMVPTVDVEYAFMNVEAEIDNARINQKVTFDSPVLDRDFRELDLSVRAYNSILRCFRKHEVTVGEVVGAYKDGRLKLVRNAGVMTLKEIRDALVKIGAMDDEDESDQ